MDCAKFDGLLAELFSAAKVLKQISTQNDGTSAAGDDLMVNDALLVTNEETTAARRQVCSILNRLHTLCASPESLIDQLATQSQLLVCMNWLSEAHLLAYIPFHANTDMAELAELANVSAYTLSRVVRLTATAGFLCEPEPGSVAHTTLSAAFSKDLCHCDAAMFLSRVTTKLMPSQAMAVTQQHPSNTTMPYDFGSISPPQFLDRCFSQSSKCGKSPKLNRQWLAYCQSLGSNEDVLPDILTWLDPQLCSASSIVLVSAEYTKTNNAALQASRAARALVQAYEDVSQDVYISRHSSFTPDQAQSCSITVQNRRPEDQQTVRNASAYILQPSSSATSLGGVPTLQERMGRELHAHASVLRLNSMAILVVAPKLLPEPGSVPVEVEAHARMQDFAALSLGQEGALEVSELVKLVEEVCDVHGSLIVAEHIRKDNGATVGLKVRHQSFVFGDVHGTLGGSAMSAYFEPCGNGLSMWQ